MTEVNDCNFVKRIHESDINNHSSIYMGKIIDI